MKQLLIIILLPFSILSSCNQKKSKNAQSEFISRTEIKDIENNKKKDTIYNYWELIHDTVSVQKDFQIFNANYKLELKTFSLNDSLIIRDLSQGEEQSYIDHSHTMVTDFKLWTDSLVDQKRIDRTDFEKSLIPKFYADCNLFSTEMDSIIGNKIYLTSNLAVPDSDNQWRVWYSIKINKNRIGNIEIKETDYVGM
jgi:hypothetical protein